MQANTRGGTGEEGVTTRLELTSMSGGFYKKGTNCTARATRLFLDYTRLAIIVDKSGTPDFFVK